MWYEPSVTVAPSAEPISVERVKEHCRILDNSLDSHLGFLIAAARQEVERRTSLVLVEQTVSIKCDRFRDFCRIDLQPVQSVASISYVDSSGIDQVLNPVVYEVRPEGPRPSIILNPSQSWPDRQSGSRITVSMVVGWPLGAAPASLLNAVLLIVAKTYATARDDLLKRRETVEGLGEIQWGGIVEVGGAISDYIDRILSQYYPRSI